MTTGKQVLADAFTATVEEGPPARVVFLGRLREAFTVTGEVTVLHTSVQHLAQAEQEAVFDALWELGQPFGLRSVALSYRAGDPGETYVVRPR